MFVRPGRLVAFEFRRQLEGGQTQPLLVNAVSDAGVETSVVLKVRDPGTPDATRGGGHYRGTSLACELVCNRLADALEVSVPECSIVEVPTALGPAVGGAVGRVLSNNVGENFGTRYVEGFDRWRAHNKTTSQSLLDALEDVLAFDATVINGDRQEAKPNLLFRGEQTYAIDHALALPVHRWPAEQIADSPLYPESLVKRHCTYSALRDRAVPFNRLHQLWTERITSAELDRLRGWLPATWETNAGDFDRIFTFLQGRPAKFDEIGMDLRRVVR